MNKISCAGVIFLTSDNKVVLEDRRKINKHGEHWSFFGGSVEEGESYEEAMRREIKEEMGFEIQWYKFFKKYTFVPDNNPNLELTYYMYLAKAPDFKILDIHKQGGVGIFTFEQAMNLEITEIDKKIILDIMNENENSNRS